ncbi:ester hydrolase C11orf54 homolog [Belonocnema kinseyi]|uniref:ester hydrolase C11orf54 homolog n=1 Tax=Belonocnema kinseyi TaxID=2817044 RepID=UPI00143CF63C|nr:ester hydrolase C11orf54 homolog [Belonocnema kinseyi]
MMIVVNVVLNSPASYPGSIAAISNAKNDDYYMERLPGDDTGITNVGNVLVSEGKPGKVVQIHVKKRIGTISAFPDNIQQILAKRYEGKIVGLGGIFLTKHGELTQHVLESGTTEVTFLYYNMSAPIISAGAIVSSETDLAFAPYHFHGFSHLKSCGHYHFDVTPDEIEYLGYFTPAKVISRVKA